MQTKNSAKVLILRDQLKEEKLKAFFRKKVCVPDSEFGSDIQVEIATDFSDICACLSLLHDNYVDSNLARSSDSGMRILTYHMLPTTFVVGAKYKGKIVGTATLIYDDYFGLPCEKIADLGIFKENNRVCEISSLAIERDFPHGRDVMLYLCKFMQLFSIFSLRIDYIFATVHPNHVLFYKSIFGFDEIDGAEEDAYDFVENAKAQVLVLDVNNAAKKQRIICSNTVDGMDNMGKFLFNECDVVSVEDSQSMFPKLNMMVLDSTYFDYFFKQMSRLYDDLPQHEKDEVKKRVLLQGPLPRKRKSVRMDDDEVLSLQYQNEMVAATSREISIGGLSVRVENLAIVLKNKFEPFILHLDRGEVEAKLVWRNNDTIGLKIVAGHELWIDYFEDKRQKKQAA